MKVLSPVILSLALLTLAAPANPASFDCAQAGAEIEHMICNDGDLSALDGLLGDRYVRALKKGEDPKAMKATQRAWLSDTRNACADVACLKGAYEARIAELTKIGWMTDEKAQAICEEVLTAIDDGSLDAHFHTFDRPTREDLNIWAAAPRDKPGNIYGSGVNSVLRIDYDADGIVETLGQLDTGGKCSTLMMADIAVGLRAPLPPAVDQDELRWLYHGTQAEDFLLVQGEPVIIAAHSFVSWLDPAGAKRALCTIGQAPNEKPKKMEKVEGNNTAPCDAVLAQRVEFAEWSADIPITREAYNSQSQFGRDFDGSHGGTTGLTLQGAEMDVDLDGELDHVAYMEYASGAGCGGDSHWLVEVDPQSHEIVESPITGIALGGMNFSLSGRSGRELPLALFTFESEPYVVANGTILAVRDGAIQPQCRIAFSYKVAWIVEEFYPVAGWPE